MFIASPGCSPGIVPSELRALLSECDRPAVRPAAVELGRHVRKTYSSFFELVKPLDDRSPSASSRRLRSVRTPSLDHRQGISWLKAHRPGIQREKKQDASPSRNISSIIKLIVPLIVSPAQTSEREQSRGGTIGQHRRVGFECRPRGCGKAFVGRHLAAEQAGQLLVPGREHIDAHHLVARYAGIGGGAAVGADQKRRWIVGDAANR